MGQHTSIWPLRLYHCIKAEMYLQSSTPLSEEAVSGQLVSPSAPLIGGLRLSTCASCTTVITLVYIIAAYNEFINGKVRRYRPALCLCSLRRKKLFCFNFVFLSFPGTASCVCFVDSTRSFCHLQTSASVIKGFHFVCMCVCVCVNLTGWFAYSTVWSQPCPSPLPVVCYSGVSTAIGRQERRLPALRRFCPVFDPDITVTQ